MSAIAVGELGGPAAYEASMADGSAERADEYAALSTLAAEVLAGLCPPALVRATWDADGAVQPELGRGLVAAGLSGVSVPVEYGGLGLGEPGLAIVAERAGRVALPGPLLESSLAALAIADWGTEAQRSRWLPALAAGQVAGTVALDWSDRAVLVPQADIADVLVWVNGPEVHVLDREQWTAQRCATADRSRRMCRVQARAERTTLATHEVSARERIFDQAAVISAAMLSGVASHLLDATREYALIRRQFGQQIGSFQAVKHRLADAYVAIAMTWPTCWDAALALADRTADASIRASVAKAFASDAAALVNDHALQCHGGIGFSWESDLHLWLKRGKALERAYGSSREHRRRIAGSLFA